MQIESANKEQTHEILSQIKKRWSPREFDPAKNISPSQISLLFEAARWAPSSYNNQSWRFIYAKRDTPSWKTLFNLLVPFNQDWAKNASVLIVAFSKTTFDHNGKPARTHAFDTGAAWENLALQGVSMGLVVHGMEGFDYEKAKKDLKIPDDYEVHAMIVVGKPGKKEDLPPALQERETPSDRKPITQFIFEGTFGGR